MVASEQEEGGGGGRAGEMDSPAADAARAAAFISSKENDFRQYVGSIATLVEADASTHARVMKTFKPASLWALYDACKVLRARFDHDGDPTPAMYSQVMSAWCDLEEKHKKRILNGWRPIPRIPRVRDAIADALDVSACESACRVVTVEPNTTETMLCSEVVLWHGSTLPAVIHVREGTTKQEAMAVLRASLAALESRWDEAINLRHGQILTEKRRDVSPRPFPENASEKTAADRNGLRSHAWRQSERRTLTAAAV